MSKYHLTNSGKVVQCRNKDCKLPDHYFGTYENALKYFGVNVDSEMIGDLKNIIIYHQLSGRVIPKLSSELYTILVDAQSESKYWAKPNERALNADNALSWAKKAGMLQDGLILKTINSSEKLACKSRIYSHNMWLEQHGAVE